MALTRPRYSSIVDSDFKQSVRTVTTTDITLIGGAPSVYDGVTFVAGDGVLVAAQANTAQNGIYSVTIVGTGSNGTWNRRFDASDGTRLTSGTQVPIADGSNVGQVYRLVTPDPITINVTALTFITANNGVAAGGNATVQFNFTGLQSGAEKFLYTLPNGNVIINSTTTSTTTNTGALVVAGGVGVAGNVYANSLYTTGLYWAGNRADFVPAGSISFTASSTAPASPTAGNFWYDTDTDIKYQYIYDGANFSWVDQSFPSSFSTLSVEGQILVNSNNEVTAIANDGTTGVGNIGSASKTFNTVFALATSANYADLAENYESDDNYAPGTVVVFGGNSEITISTVSHDTRVAGVISTNPAYLMNAESVGLPVAFTGRVPCQVLGPVDKGDVLTTSNTAGVAQRMMLDQFRPGCVLGKALEPINTDNINTIEIVVGRF
jgi:hypothetical protein